MTWNVLLLSVLGLIYQFGIRAVLMNQMNVYFCKSELAGTSEVHGRVFLSLEKRENANNILFLSFSGYLFPTQDVIPTLKPLFSLYLLHSHSLTHRAWLCILRSQNITFCSFDFLISSNTLYNIPFKYFKCQFKTHRDKTV